MNAPTPDFTAEPGSLEDSPLVHAFFDKATSTWTYIVVDPATKEAVVIDTVLEYDPVSGKVGTTSVQGLAAFLKQNGYEVTRIIETHVHADHATGALALKQLLPNAPPIYIGRKVSQVQESFASTYGLEPAQFQQSFDGYMDDGGTFTLGHISVKTCGLPGHTPDSMGILIGDSLFAGDSIFLPDVGTARADFPGGNATHLYTSIQRILQLDADVRVFSGHDYPVGREKSCMSLISEQAGNNKHVGRGTVEADFRSMRETRDASLGTPRLLHASLQINLRGGRMPAPDAQGRRFILIPLSGVMPT